MVKSKWIRSLAVGAALVFGGASLATTFSLAEVNRKVKELLVPFNTGKTQAEIVFHDLRLADFGARSLNVSALLKKVGTWNTLEFSIPEFRYRNTGRGYPRVAAEASLKLDLVTALGQALIDEVAGEAERLILELARGLTEEYGDAISISAEVDEFKRDKDGHAELLRLHVEAAINLSRLPEAMKAEDVPILWARGEAVIGQQGAELKLVADLNKTYHGFNSDDQGLKEWIQGLLSDDAQVFTDLTRAAGIADALADQLVNRRAGEN